MALITKHIIREYNRVKGKMLSYKNRITTLINKFNIVHNYQYSYDNMDYQGSRKNITITCLLHGDFQQRCDVHLKGSGCPSCFRIRQGWGKTDFINACSKHDNQGTLYVIRCYNITENFYKIGITGQTIFQRFGSENKPTIRMPYNFEVIQLIQQEASIIWDLEQYLHKLYKDYQYIPEIKFPGYKECFQMSNC